MGLSCKLIGKKKGVMQRVENELLKEKQERKNKKKRNR